MTCFDNIPEPLRGARRWVSFRIVKQLDGTLKKTPLTIRGTLARADSPIDWSTLPEVLKAIEFSIGSYPAIALGADYPLRVVDLDYCINGREDLLPMAREIVERAGDTYIEKSVSGKGIHILTWSNGTVLPTNPFPGVEVYCGVPRFIVMTGNLWNPLPTRDTMLNRQIAYREAGVP